MRDVRHVSTRRVRWIRPPCSRSLARVRSRRLPTLPKAWPGDVIAVMDHAKVKKAHLIGASAGATVSGWLASERPERVSSLALLMANSGNPLNPMPADPVRMASVGMPPATGAGIEDRRTLLAAMNKAPEADEPTRSPEVRQQVA